jgi:hypothetical protein
MPYAQPFMIIPGSFMFVELPPANVNKYWFAYCTDINGGTYCVSDGIKWRPVDLKRLETYNGITDSNGDYTVVYPVAFPVIPHVNPTTYPAADGLTRVRVTGASTTGFTVKTEKNATVNLLGIDILGIGTANVASVPVRVLVLES